ncbi:D-sedoheptulose-7-phosphate isomerase [Thermostaphylospora chromogena]|uniref:D-sedoheptulose 7-phosphate isomerase n=1 Tax=Thermostaphylospora chromogena TaxID=35622 RepID=A0A1H1GZU7_9ACTN|nr:SIS domain-containing protein [Thermostaphylospora chromogena]SDR18700.1 D-sedoheptulose 7-phosphate isomerase [Thermostaphylospora chromogena]
MDRLEPPPAVRPSPSPGTGEPPAEALGCLAARIRETARLHRRMRGPMADRLAECAEEMASRFTAGGRLFTFGNGGSATDARRAAAAFAAPGPGGPLPAMCLAADAALITALSGDAGFATVFAGQFAVLARPGDIALGLSTGGGSANVVRGFAEAKRRGLLTVGMAGGQGGVLAGAGILDHLFVVPSHCPHRIQEAQAALCGALAEVTRLVLAGAGH